MCVSAERCACMCVSLMYMTAEAGHNCTFLIAETSGALAPGSVRFLHDLADAAAAVNRHDTIAYGEAHMATAAFLFFTHHLRRA